MQIGYCTFTRAARREAAKRSSDLFGVTLTDLEKSGWFRTIHSAVMRLLGTRKGQIVNYDVPWLREATGDDGIEASSDEDDGEGWTSQWRGKSPAVTALGIWDVARSRLLPLSEIWDDITYRLGHVGGLDSLAEAEEIVERFERAKAADERLDFTDCLLRYAGFHATVEGVEKADPEGSVPDLPVWLFDEAQDTSPLLDHCARRLSQNAIWLYLGGDPEQSVYEWAGADGQAFMHWPVVHQEYLKKTYRCARKIIEAGLRLIWQNDEISTELKMLAVEPRCEGGKIDTGHEDDLLDYLKDPSVPTLVMARTNQKVSYLQQQLSFAGIPWKSAKSPKRWPPLASTKTVEALSELANGGMIDGEAWRRIVASLPAGLFERGTKSRFAKAESKDTVDFVTLFSVREYGGTEAFCERLCSGDWKELVSKEERLAAQCKEKWGDLANDPKIICSTIHGTKGMEAERVLLATQIGGPVAKNLRTPEGRDEERRVWYVGATRAREELVLLRGRGQNYEELYDAV
jgi:DNA helicase II / ATP-dependent DNA helicase PcrA